MRTVNPLKIYLFHNVAQHWYLLTMQKVLGIILEKNSGPPNAVHSLWQLSINKNVREEQNPFNGTLSNVLFRTFLWMYTATGEDVNIYLLTHASE